ncbi:MAG: Smr/MutS family protein [Proteobacteria bacterium]|nr:Smr/MutS family protein [Pseudomonadota bacterium]
MSRDGKRRVLSYEERVLWSMITKSMTPLRSGKVEAIEPEDEQTEAVPSPKSRSAKVTLDEQSPRPAPLAPKLAAIAPPLTRRAKRGLARGKQDIDARLDLHGLTQSEAHHVLLRFLRSASARGARLVLVITGKGRSGSLDDSTRERGVLRRQVPQWLSLPEFRAYVIGFEDAHIAHGGEGALYVRVRRAKD